jgi:sarcosine oxidase
MTKTFDTIVAGVGGMGSAALHQLARRGQRVLGLDQFETGHTQGSSHGETRIFRLAYFEGSNYVPILRRAQQLWRDLGTAAGQPLLHTTGSLEMSEPGYDFFDRSQASCLEHGLPHEILDVADVRRRFPAFQLRPGTRTLFQPDGAFVLSEVAIRAHVALARTAGAELHTGEKMLDFKPTADGGVQVRTDRATYNAGNLVLTTGPWIRDFVPQLMQPIATFKQTIAWFTPRKLENFLPATLPVFIFFGDQGDFYGMPQYSTRGFKIGGPHFARVPIDPNNPDRTPAPEQLSALQDFLAAHMPDAAGQPIAAAGCIYTKTPDEHFVIDRLPGASQVIVVSACSGHGYKFTPAIGEIVAQLVVDGATTADIAPFAIARFSGEQPAVL